MVRGRVSSEMTTPVAISSQKPSETSVFFNFSAETLHALPVFAGACAVIAMPMMIFLLENKHSYLITVITLNAITAVAWLLSSLVSSGFLSGLSVFAGILWASTVYWLFKDFYVRPFVIRLREARKQVEEPFENPFILEGVYKMVEKPKEQ